MDAEPGAFEQIPAGLELAKWDPQHPNSTYPSVVKAWLRGVAAGLGTSYHTLANDMEAVNFASGMIGLADERDNWTNIQHWFIEDFEEPVHTAWLEMALLSGALDPLPMSKFDKFNAPSFSGRRWDFVNPDVEVSALEKRLRLRLTSITRELAKQNIDRDELFQEIEDDTREMEKRRITPVEVLEAMANVEKAEAQAAAAAQPKAAPFGQAA
jgi:lambda family phage portal protein